MKFILIAVLMGVAVLLITSSCATAPPKPLAPGELRLLSMAVSEQENVRAHLPFAVTISFEADGEPQIRLACFYFGDYGPHCFRVTDVNYGLRGTIKVRISTSYHGPQFIKGYVVYIRDGKTQQTNMVRTFYSIAP